MWSPSPTKLDFGEEHKQFEHDPLPEPENRIKVDGTGLPLVPQPSTSEVDPLNYPNWLKWLILGQVSIIGAVSTLNISIINPAVVPLAEEFSIAPVTATYQTTITIGVNALGPLIFTPIANVYGRRPVYLITLLIGFASAAGSAVAKSYGTLIIARIFNGLGGSPASVLGAGTISDMCYMHQRGKAMGVYTVMMTNGAHLAAIIGGYVALKSGWRWCFWTGAILNGAMFVICLFFLPETIYTRPPSSYDDELSTILKSDNIERAEYKALLKQGEVYTPPALKLQTYFKRLGFWYSSQNRRLRCRDFIVKPLSMLKYPSATFPALYYGIVTGFASIEPGLILATLFTRIYHFNTAQNGLANGISLLVGSTLGEFCSGPVTDVMMRRARKRALDSGKTAAVEVRLQGIWTGAITVPIGLLIYGFTLRYAHTFVAPCIGMAIASFGTQIVASVCYTYSCNDCYSVRSNDVSICFGLTRQLFGLTLGFYSLPFGEKIGFQWSFTVFAAICIIFFFPIIGLMIKGEEWRTKLGNPPSD